MIYDVVFSPEAEEQLASLFRYLADAASPEVAERYTEAIVSYCESLRRFPHRGTTRDDVRPGLRITNFKKRAVIAFDVAPGLVSIIGVFYGGRDFETLLRSEHEDDDN
jgi:plasmid stabilization system protein ParE